MNSLKGFWASKPTTEGGERRKSVALSDSDEQGGDHQSSQSDSGFALVHEEVNISTFDGYDAEELKIKLLEKHKKNEELSREKVQLQKKLAQLESQFERLEGKFKEARDTNNEIIKDIHHQYRTKWGGHIQRLDAQLKEAYIRNTTLQKENRIFHTQLLRSRTEQAESKRLHHLAEESVTKCEQQIVKLTETISRSSQRNDASTATRDDDYFGTEFSELANAIQQWVFRHFRGGSDQRLETLDPVLQDSFDKVILKDEPLKTSRAQLDAISAIIANQLTSHVFPQFRYLGIADLHDPFLALFNCIGGTDIQRQTWRARTMDMIYKHETVTKVFGETVKLMADSLEQPLGPLAAKTSREEQRNRTLHGLVERAAKLAVEVAKQHSHFQLYSVTPGQAFDSWIMEDAVAAAEEDDKEGKDGVVRVLLFPAILRRDYDQEGKLLRGSVVVLKAKVLVKFS